MTNWVMKEHGIPDSKITVLSIAKEKSSDGHLMWECLCECGNVFQEVGRKIREARTLSCGCYVREFKKDKSK